MKKRLLTVCLVPILFAAIIKVRAGGVQLENVQFMENHVIELSDQVSHLQNKYTSCLGEVVMKTKSFEHATVICEEENLALQYSIDMLNSAIDKGGEVSPGG